MSEMPASVQGQACCPNLALWAEALAGVAALVAAGGSLYLTLGERLIACPLCLYQRMAAMSVAIILIAGWLFVQPPGRGLSVMAFPLSVCGLTVAAFHVWKEWSGAMVCPMGLWDVGTAPQQSLAAFSDDNGAFRREYYRRCRPDALVEPWLSGAGAAGSAGSSRGFFADRFRTAAKRPWGLRNSATEAPSA
jgi:hypothetical protein